MTATPQAIKELRDKTAAGFMDCKKALEENGGNIEQAIDWLRKKGIASAAKKAGRTAAEGLIVIAASADKKQAAVIELNSETDFVAKNAEFQASAQNIANIALAKTDGNLEAVCEATCNTLKQPVSEIVKALVGKIGENLVLRRTAKLSVNNGIVATYIHNAYAPNMGKIGVLVALESTAPADKLEALGKQIAMHIAAAKPEALTREEVSSDKLDREKSIFVDQARASGKPDNVIEKMVEGRINKFYGEVVLPEQLFVIDGKTKISDFVAQAGKDAGAEIKITGFKLFILGEGVEKSSEEIAA